MALKRPDMWDKKSGAVIEQGELKEHNIAMDNTQDDIKETKQDDEISTSQDTTQYTTQDTNKITFQIPNKVEPFSKRLVANVTPSQKIFVQKMSKKFENESAFVRFMLDRFMKDIDLGG